MVNEETIAPTTITTFVYVTRNDELRPVVTLMVEE